MKKKKFYLPDYSKRKKTRLQSSQGRVAFHVSINKSIVLDPELFVGIRIPPRPPPPFELKIGCSQNFQKNCYIINIRELCDLIFHDNFARVGYIDLTQDFLPYCFGIKMED